MVRRVADMSGIASTPDLATDLAIASGGKSIAFDDRIVAGKALSRAGTGKGLRVRRCPSQKISAYFEVEYWDGIWGAKFKVSFLTTKASKMRTKYAWRLAMSLVKKIKKSKRQVVSVFTALASEERGYVIARLCVRPSVRPYVCHKMFHVE
jgi:hypothetical protein